MSKSLSLRNLLVQNQNKDPPTCKYLHSYLGSFVEPWKFCQYTIKLFYPFTKWSSLLNCHHSSQTKGNYCKRRTNEVGLMTFDS
jgi:hypothetical protein